MRAILIAAGAAALFLGGCETLQTAGLAPPPAEAATPAAAPSTNAEPSLLEAERRVAADAQARGYEQAIASALHADGFLVRPGAITTFSQAAPPPAAPLGGPVFWQNDKVTVSASGDMGLTSGRYVQVLPGVEAAQGRYIMVWRKDGAGDWRIFSETRVPDPPRAPVRATARRR